jgi:isoleucyl-tRNA synthetase
MRADGRIGASLQAEIAVHADAATADALKAATLGDEARFLFITSQATFVPVEGRPDDAAKVEGIDAFVVARPTTHAKCIRCWHHRADVGSHADDPELCGRCVGNVEGPGETRRWF